MNLPCKRVPVNELQIFAHRSRILPRLCGATKPEFQDAYAAFYTAHSTFSNKAENHTHSVALFAMYCNFFRIRKILQVTPAVIAAIEKRLWEIGDIVKVC